MICNNKSRIVNMQLLSKYTAAISTIDILVSDEISYICLDQQRLFNCSFNKLNCLQAILHIVCNFYIFIHIHETLTLTTMKTDSLMFDWRDWRGMMRFDGGVKVKVTRLYSDITS